MNALERNRFSDAWRAFGASAPAPRAVLSISAHWFIHATAVTAMRRPRTIHDFYGFPKELFDVEYPAPGSPEIAELIIDVVKPVWVGLDQDTWGIDHGTWSVLVHVFPDATVPVLQLAINATEPLEYHLDLGARLAPLLDEGVMVIGSGNVVHNLGRLDWSRPEGGFDWAERFDAAAREIVLDAPADVARLEEHPDHRLAVPTPDHFLPFVYLAGLVAARGGGAQPLVEGCAMGGLSMTSYSVGASVDPPAGGGPPAPLPDPHLVPPGDTNV